MKGRRRLHKKSRSDKRPAHRRAERLSRPRSCRSPDAVRRPWRMKNPASEAPWTAAARSAALGIVARQRPMGDIAPHVLALKFYHLRSLVGAGNRKLQRGCHRGYGEHPTPVGYELAILERGARVENLDADLLHCPSNLRIRGRIALYFFDAGYGNSLAIAAGVAGRREYHGGRTSGRKVDRNLPEVAFRSGQQQGAEVTFKPHHQGLAFRIAEARVELDHPNHLLLHHQPRIQHAPKRHSPRIHFPQRGVDDLAHDALFKLGGKLRHRRVRAHPARVWSAVPVEDGLVVLAGPERDRVLTVAQRKER